MHVRRGLGRLVAALAIVTFALPLTAITTSAITSAQTPTVGSTSFTGSIAGVGSVTAANPIGSNASISIDPLGQTESFTFTCQLPNTPTGGSSYAVSVGGAPLVDPTGAGCYNVDILASNASTGNSFNIGQSDCWGIALNGNTVDPGTGNPVGNQSGGTAECDYIYPQGDASSPGVVYSTATTSIQGTTDNSYAVEFQGLVPAVCPSGYQSFSQQGTAASSVSQACVNTSGATTDAICPAGTGPTPTWETSLNSFSAGTFGAFCQFTVTGQKKYVEIYQVTLTAPSGGCGSALTYAEGLKAYFGPSCTLTATALGQTVIKYGEDCSNASEVAADEAAVAAGEFGTGAKYVCAGSNLLVENIPVPGATITFKVTGQGALFSSVSAIPSGSLLNGTLCTGTGGSTSLTATGSSTGAATAVLCPTGVSGGSVQACVASTVNQQVPVCSTSIPFLFTITAARVVPQVKWAGEKVVLTKCFGAGMGNNYVEFTLQSTGAPLNASLIPASLYDEGTGGVEGPGYYTNPSADTVWTYTNPEGCASVIGYAQGEGVLNVDAAIYAYATAGGTTSNTEPLINEHAFEVFYLKFERVDLENLTPSTYATKTGFAPYYNSFLAGTTAFGGASTFPTSFPNDPSNMLGGFPNAPGTGEVAGATGYQVPLCQTQFIRAMVHGYFEMPGDPSGRPAATVAIPNAPQGSAGSYVLPAGRWVLPEDWPLLATFAGVSPAGTGSDITPSSYYAWDLNSGFVFNPAGEAPVLCESQNVATPGAFAPSAIVSGNGPITAYDTGPCYGSYTGTFASGTNYTTAPNPSCTGGETVGIGPFDPTQSCTDIVIPTGPTPGTTTGPCPSGSGNCLFNTGPNSTYLPNGTLNEWDAPMPPAQVSFGVSNGPGYLSEVNKTGLYSLVFDTGSIPAAGCPTGYSPNAGTGTCQIVVNPDPFYAEAIPASPLIPPVMNDGGYLWDSWNFSATTNGGALSVTGAPFSGVAAGGFVPGESTSLTVGANVCPAGFTLGTGALPCSASGISATDCGTLYGGFYGVITGTCAVAAFTPGTYRGGTNVSAYVDDPTTQTATVTVMDGRGFYPGEYVQTYQGGNCLFYNAQITAITADPQPGFPYAVTLTLDTSHTEFGDPTINQAPGTIVVVGEDFGLPVSSVASIGDDNTVVLTLPDGSLLTCDVSHIDATNNIIFVSGGPLISGKFSCSADVIATLISPACAGISNYDGPIPSGSGAANGCEPSELIPSGTTFYYSGEVAGTQITTAPPNPYPFWQWVSGQSSATPSSATVYSDNHGEAVVALQTTVTSSTVSPTNGTCPSGTTPVSNGGVVTTCLVNFTTLGAAGFQNLSSTTLKPILSGGCLATFPSGTTAVIPNGSGSIIPATGPGAGQICINGLGGIEFGTGAVLGTTSVQAIADYPYTRGVHPAIASPGLTKVWTSQFAKTLAVSAGTAGPANTTTYTVTITAKDVCGNPITNEPVQVYALSGSGTGAVLAPISGGIILASTGNSATVTPDHTGTATLSLEVLNSAIGTGGLVIKAVWPYERVERFVTVISGTSGQSASVVYPPGWQQVGGPPGSNFSTAEALFSWDPATSTYSDVTSSDAAVSSAPPACSGYWAYFAAAMTVSLQPTSKSGDTATCQLAAGWNLVGNPFGTPAILPSGTVAYHWNGTSYDATNQIPLGGSDWVYMAAAGSLVLTAS